MKHSKPRSDAERDAILQAIENAGGNMSRAAQLLGVARATLYRSMGRNEIETRMTAGVVVAAPADASDFREFSAQITALAKTRKRPGRPKPGGDAERDAILQAIENAGGNMSRAAQFLGVARATLYRRIKRNRIGIKKGVVEPERPGGPDSGEAPPEPGGRR